MAGNTPHNPIQSTFPAYNHQADPVPKYANKHEKYFSKAIKAFVFQTFIP